MAKKKRSSKKTAKIKKVVKKKAVKKKAGAAGRRPPVRRRSLVAKAVHNVAGAGLVAVKIGSSPKQGMHMKMDAVSLGNNPQSLQLTLGEHLLEWTFAGPPNAEFMITVTGARDPTEPIRDKIAPDQDIAAGSYRVLV